MLSGRPKGHTARPFLFGAHNPHAAVLWGTRRPVSGTMLLQGPTLTLTLALTLNSPPQTFLLQLRQSDISTTAIVCIADDYCLRTPVSTHYPLLSYNPVLPHGLALTLTLQCSPKMAEGCTWQQAVTQLAERKPKWKDINGNKAVRQCKVLIVQAHDCLGSASGEAD